LHDGVTITYKEISMKKDVATTETADTTALAVMDGAAQDALKEMMEKVLKKTTKYKLYPTIAAQHGVKKPKFEVEGQDDQDTISGVVVQYETMREYREGKDDLAPTCSSVGGQYGTAFGKCSECQYGKWEECDDGKRRKECKDNVKLIIVAKGLPGRYEMKVAPTSMKNWSDYEKMLANDEQIPVAATVTNIGLTVQSVTGKKPWSVLTFEMGESIAEIDDKAFQAEVFKGIAECKNIFVPTKESAVQGKKPKVNSGPAIEDAEVVDDDTAVESVDSGEIPF